ncbi:hypothetical protein PoB_002058900 [Plakobranchus ocellatus]|uniref:Uncharacterized protein n=1 Tax=Plakobranchus ocellatus TaxID=259542 RepID=A0AAV3ZI57_9GAST|nr:hypothetical protein PoB_002058900 [Plakobranchus ocellatus]
MTLLLLQLHPQQSSLVAIVGYSGRPPRPPGEKKKGPRPTASNSAGCHVIGRTIFNLATGEAGYKHQKELESGINSETTLSLHVQENSSGRNVNNFTKKSPQSLWRESKTQDKF